MFPGLIESIFNDANIPRTNPIPNRYFNIIKEVFCDDFYGGCEPEFTSTESFEYWEGINNTNFVYITENEAEILDDTNFKYYKWRCPYVNKDIPFLVDLRN